MGDSGQFFRGTTIAQVRPCVPLVLPCAHALTDSCGRLGWPLQGQGGAPDEVDEVPALVRHQGAFARVAQAV